MPNIPETVAAFLAVTSLGAVWSSCSPDMGTGAVLDRFKQIEPKVLFAVDGYRYGGKPYDRRAVVAEIVRALPSLESVVFLPYLDPGARLDDVPEAFRGQASSRARPSSPSNRCRSIIRCGSSTRRAPPACRRRSCTVTAAS